MMKGLDYGYDFRHVNISRLEEVVERSINIGTTVSTDGFYKMIIDSGADTSVIGAGWRITHYYGRTVNLVGFDREYARKKNLSLVFSRDSCSASHRRPSFVKDTSGCV